MFNYHLTEIIAPDASPLPWHTGTKFQQYLRLSGFRRSRAQLRILPDETRSMDFKLASAEREVFVLMTLDYWTVHTRKSHYGSNLKALQMINYSPTSPNVRQINNVWLRFIHSDDSILSITDHSSVNRWRRRATRRRPLDYIYFPNELTLLTLPPRRLVRLSVYRNGCCVSSPCRCHDCVKKLS